MASLRTGLILGLAGHLGLLAALAVTVGLGRAGWLAGAACGLVTCGLLAWGLFRAEANTLGPANRVTLIRATLVAGVTALAADGLKQPTATGVLVGLASIALVLDGVDGWVARRTGTTSRVGAQFDMEVDSFLVLVLSLCAIGTVGPWVLAIGLPRYGFGAAGWLVPWLRLPLPPRYWRKPVAAIQGIVLTAAVAGFLPAPVLDIALVVVAVLLAESFGRDVIWQWRQHRRGPSEAVVAAVTSSPGAP